MNGTSLDDQLKGSGNELVLMWVWMAPVLLLGSSRRLSQAGMPGGLESGSVSSLRNLLEMFFRLSQAGSKLLQMF